MTTQRNGKVSADTLHGLMGHINDTACRETAKYLGLKVTRGKMTLCGACAEARAKQKSLPSRTEIVRVVVNPKEVAKKVNERVHLDISTIKAPKELKMSVAKPHWLMKVDERTEMKWSTFQSNKSDIVEPTCEEFRRWRQNGKPLGIVRCDNAGENKKLEQRLKIVTWKVEGDFEYTARSTPQKNSLVEVGISTIRNRACAMMIAANISYAMRYKLFRWAGVEDARWSEEKQGRVLERAITQMG